MQVITMLKQKIRCAEILVRKKLFSKTVLHNTTFLFLLLIPKKYYSVYEKIKQKKTPVVYKTDKITNLHRHEILRTPVRHCELNPIELIWAQVKGFVAKNNTTFRLKDVKELTYALSEKLQKMCGQKQKNMWSKLKKNTYRRMSK